MEIKEDLRYNHFYALNENNKNKQLDWSAKKDGKGVFLSNLFWKPQTALDLN